ncbi:MAG: AgmX/PglI C-terminal domain-containing protein [Myxococcota bacterium]|jgi:hypothetical protein|nr:AgmX/PglI C-terminal domain-containing protein [Myxococcota bacterium]
MAAPNPTQAKNNPPPGARGARPAEPPKPEGPKVLRIGIIQGGKIIEERIIRTRDTVTVGPSEKNTFVIASNDLPNRFELFETKDGAHYTLNFTDVMTGRLAFEGGVKDLAELRTSGKARAKGKVYQLDIDDKSRGKVVIGETTVLYQFVAPPPIQPRPQLPAAVRGGLFKDIEWFVTIALLVSLVGHVGFVGALVAHDWPKVSMMDKYMQLQELIAASDATFEDKKQADQADTNAEGDAATDKEEDKKASDDKKNAGKSKAADEDQGPKKSAEEVARERAERRAALAEQLAQRGLNKILGSMGGGEAGGAISDVLRGGDVGADQDELLSQVAGVGVATGDAAGKLRGPAGGKGSGEAADIDQIRMAGGDADVRTSGAGSERAVRGNVKRRDPTAVDGTGVLNPQEVAKVVARRIGAIKGCYERALRRNPNLEGKITVRFTVAGSGKVTSANATQNELGGEVGDCIISAFKAFRFPPPEGGSATFEYPFMFTPAG